MRERESERDRERKREGEGEREGDGEIQRKRGKEICEQERQRRECDALERSLIEWPRWA